MPEKVLPEAVEAFIDAMNRFDLEGLLSTFAPDAIVNDHRREFRGQEAIRAWLAKEIVGDREDLRDQLTITIDPATARDFDDAIMVEEYVVPVTVFPDGSFTDEDGNVFGPKRPK